MKRITHILLAAFLAPLCLMAQDRDFTPGQKLGMANFIIENFYVEPVDADSIVDSAIVAMLKTLDPHSAYSTPEETKELTQPLDGKFSGIGVQFNMSTDTVYVIQTVGGGPSERVGIMPGDRIIWADDSLLAGRKLPNTSVMKILRGEKGSKVRLKVKRGNNPDLIEFTVTRDDIPIYSVDDTYMAAPGVGYIHVSRFAKDTGYEVEQAISKLKKQGMQKLILDLQGNGGGYLGAAVDVASIFLNPGDPVVSTRGRIDAADYKAERTSQNFKGDLVILVDQYSASTSEILAGAIQDNDRGTIVGRRTFGKGLVQRPFPMADGSMIRLTVSKYYTPSGRCIQRPYDKGHSEEYYLDMLNRYKGGELFHADSIHYDENLKYQTLKKGRTVYGGGGITPDFFVPVDTTYFTDYYRDLVAKGAPARFSLKYIDRHRAELQQAYPTEDAFFAGFKVSPEMIEEMVEMAKDDGLEPNHEQLAQSRPVIEGIMMGLLTRDLFEDGNYSRATNPLNPIFTTALHLLTEQ